MSVKTYDFANELENQRDVPFFAASYRSHRHAKRRNSPFLIGYCWSSWMKKKMACLAAACAPKQPSAVMSPDLILKLSVTWGRKIRPVNRVDHVMPDVINTFPDIKQIIFLPNQLYIDLSKSIISIGTPGEAKIGTAA